MSSVTNGTTTAQSKYVCLCECAVLLIKNLNERILQWPKSSLFIPFKVLQKYMLAKHDKFFNIFVKYLGNYNSNLYSRFT